MVNLDFLSLVKDERQKFIRYAASLLKGTEELEAEDVVHDVLVKVLERADNLSLENLAAYIYRSVRNRLIDYTRTRKSAVSLDTGHDQGGLSDLLKGARPDAALQTNQGKQQLFEALQALGDMERQVIIAHELEGIPYKELAQSWQIPQNTLLSHKARAMKKLRKHFSTLNKEVQDDFNSVL